MAEPNPVASGHVAVQARAMPVDFLSDDQLAAYCHIVSVPSRSELERYFFLDDANLKLVNNRRPDTHRLGFAIALGTVG